MAFPKLRFKNAEGAEFTSWVTSFIGDECKITTGNKDTQNKIDGGKYPFFVRSQTVERINTYSKDCEAILTSGDGVGVGKNYHYINGKFDFHQRVYCLYDFSNQLLGKYLYIYFSNYFFDRVKRLSAKNSVDSVRMDMISKMEIKLPSLVEQTKIASFLSNVDEKISQLTQKHALLSQYKQGMMQKLFSQQIRFKADDGSEFGEWDEKILSELFDYANGKSFEAEVIENGSFKLITLNSIDIKGNLKNSHKTISQGDNSLLRNDLIMILSDVAHGNFLGLTAIIPDNSFVLNQRVGRLRSKTDINICYMRFYINFNQKYFKLNGQGSSQLNLSKGDVLSFPVNLPCLEEQTKIANFLSSIDQKIEVVAQQIEQAKQWKKGLLQQMFV